MFNPHIESMESMGGIHILNPHSQSISIPILREWGKHIWHAYMKSIGLNNWIQYMDFLYGFSIWIQNMASIFPCHVCIPYIVFLYAISIWIRDIHLVHGLNIWIQYVGSLCAFNIWIQYIHSIHAFLYAVRVE